jgi:predicted permease
MSNSNHNGMWARTLDGVSNDIRLALRMVSRSPGLTATIALTLALGIGANAAIFGVINSLLLRPLPVADPSRLVTISSDSAIARGQAGVPWSFAMWEELQPHASLFDGAFAWTPAGFDLAERGERQPVAGIFASGGYFETLGVAAIRGRTFTPADDRPGGGANGAVAIISYGLWQRRFAGADSVIGASLVVDGATVTIVGVTAPEFRGLDVGSAFDVALPLETEPLIRGSRSALRTSRLLVMLRLKRGQSVEAGTATLRSLQLGSAPAPNSEPFTLAPAATGASLPVRGPYGLRQSYARPLLTILMVALLVLLIACINIANLLLARATARRYELGVRLALGASRARLARQLLIESLIFAVFGAIGGLVIAQWSSQALVAQLSTPVHQIALDLSFDWRVWAFTAAVALVTASIFGTVSAFRSTRIAPLDVLKKMRAQADSSPGAGMRGLATMSSSLVILQVALSLALVIAAALLVGSFARLSSVPLGFDPDRVLVVNVDTERVRADAFGRMRLFDRILDAVRVVPGVAHAGGSIWTPVDGGMRMGDSQYRIAFNFITPGWFAAYGTSLRAGRDFTVRDTAGTSPVVIVNDAFVRAFMPGASPLGKTIPHPRSRPEVPRTIVGVVDDAVFDSQREGIQPIVYLPMAQSGEGPAERTAISLGVRPAVGAPIELARSVGDAVRAVDPDLSFSFGLLEDHVQASVRQERVVAMLSGFFGALALVIAALGLYGVTSYTVHRRVTEIGIRRALGAQRAHVLGLVLLQSLTLTGVGIGIGLAVAASTTRALRGLLFGLTPLDPAIFIGVAALFGTVATLAALFPAHRATRVDPLVALRNE